MHRRTYHGFSTPLVTYHGLVEQPKRRKSRGIFKALLAQWWMPVVITAVAQGYTHQLVY
jgi:hypothetical protein